MNFFKRSMDNSENANQEHPSYSDVNKSLIKQQQQRDASHQSQLKRNNNDLDNIDGSKSTNFVTNSYNISNSGSNSSIRTPTGTNLSTGQQQQQQTKTATILVSKTKTKTGLPLLLKNSINN